MESEVTDLPDPDSPTMARISPRPTEKEISFSAWNFPVSVLKLTERSLTWRRGFIYLSRIIFNHCNV
jgi:hypothetical protein